MCREIMSRNTRHTFIVALGAMALAAPGRAQTQRATAPLPPIPAGAVPMPTEPATAAQALANVLHRRDEARLAISIARADYPYDSIRTVVNARAHHMLSTLKGRGCEGIQLVACGQLFALASMDDSAQVRFDARAAMAGVTVADKAYAYSIAVETFADYQRPERLELAERYLTKLYALGPKAAPRQIEAEYMMTVAYYNGYQYDAAARHASTIGTMLTRVPYKYRQIFFNPQSERYGILIAVLSHTANGAAKIEAFNANLRGALSAMPDSVALDYEFANAERESSQGVTLLINAHALIGQSAKPITSNYWINTADTTPHDLPLRDGKIRLIEFGSTSCWPCVQMYSGLQRIYDLLEHRVEPVIVTGTGSRWGNRVLPSAELAGKYKSWFLDERKISYPIALYKSPYQPAEYGDDVGEYNPNYSEGEPGKHAYIFLGKPTVYLVDGAGIIRRVFVGYSREMEQHIVLAARHLLTESSRTTSSSLSRRSTPVDLSVLSTGP